MSKILDWIKKHVWQTILIGLAAFFVPLILVHVAYRISAVSPWFASTWEAGELITYIAGFEAFIGTVFLGSVAAKQNEIAINLSEKQIKVQESQGLFERQPELSIVPQTKQVERLSDLLLMNVCVFASIPFLEKRHDGYFDNETLYIFQFALQNKSDFKVITTLTSLEVSNHKDSFILEFRNSPWCFVKYPIHIEKGAEENIAFVLKPSEINKKDVSGKMVLNLENSISEMYSLIIYFSIVNISGSLQVSVFNQKIIRI